MGFNYDPLLDDLFLYSYEEDFFIQGFLKKIINGKKLARSFNFTLCYIYHVLSLNNSNFGDFFFLIGSVPLSLK